MNYYLMSALWLLIALTFGLVISFADRIKNLERKGILFILFSYSGGLAFMLYAITELY